MSWYDWNLDLRERDLLEFTQRLIAFRHAQPVLRRNRFFEGQSIHGSAIKDVEWFKPDGTEMTDQDWNEGHVLCLGICLNGGATTEINEKEQLTIGDLLLVLLNAGQELLSFTMPQLRSGVPWQLLFDTADSKSEEVYLMDGDRYTLEAHSLAVLRLGDKDASGAR